MSRYRRSSRLLASYNGGDSGFSYQQWGSIHRASADFFGTIAQLVEHRPFAVDPRSSPSDHIFTLQEVL